MNLKTGKKRKQQYFLLLLDLIGMKTEMLCLGLNSVLFYFEIMCIFQVYKNV